MQQVERAEQAAEQIDGILQRGALAALAICERGLHQETHPNFEDFCREHWGWSKSKVLRQLTWGRDLSTWDERALQPPRGGRVPELGPAPSQRAAMQARKDAKEAERLAEQAAADAAKPTNKSSPEIPAAQQPDPPDPKADTRPDPEKEALRIERDAYKAELERIELDRNDVPPVVTAEGVSADFMAEMAAALGLAAESPPATMLAKARALMTEHAKRKPAKTSAPKVEPKLATVTPIGDKCPPHPKAKVRWAGVGKICDECHTIVKPNERIG